MKKPIRDQDKVKGMRQRQRANGSWRVWWEPKEYEAGLGFKVEDLDPLRPTWSIKRAKQINKAVMRAQTGNAVARTGPGGRTIDALIADYKGSRHYPKKAGTRRSYKTNMGAISRKWGTYLAINFSKPIMDEWYETIMDTSGIDYANQLVSMMSILFSHAEIRGWRPELSNPCFRLKKIAGTKRSRFASWDEFDALLSAADALGWPAMAAGIGLATFNPPRQGDVISAKLDDFHDFTYLDEDGDEHTVLAWGKYLSKKGNFNGQPVHHEIVTRIRNLLDAATGDQEILLIDPSTKRPYSGDLFRKRWAKIRALAAKTCPTLTERGNALQYRDLRRTFGVWSRYGGASKSDVGDVLGNSAGQDPTLAGIYMPATFYTAMRAINAVQRPEPTQRKKA